ncbi:glycoside hydrolase family 2 protein [Ekhidna sp.]
MRLNKGIILVLIIVAFACEQAPSLSRKMLNDGWEFKQEHSNDWRNASVPGVVHTDLISHDMIPHPWKGTNENDVQWIENENWLYRTSFTISNSILERNAVDLVFEGLDTYADVRLNGRSILTADNMFRTWRKDVSDLLVEGENTLEIKFISPLKMNAPKLEALGYELPASNETAEMKVSPFTRKSPFQFGWDWGPRLVTSGIWRPVYLEAYDRVRIVDVQVVQKELSEDVAKLEALVELDVEMDGTFEINVMGQEVTRDLRAGMQVVSMPFNIKNPKRWWPAGWGEQNLYDIPVSISFSEDVIDEEVVNIGLREVELVNEADAIGESFYFKINGEPVFARGANYIPQSHFLPSVTTEDYVKLIEDARASGINMIRVWGGGIYENDIFYDLCDKNGILVWQDFMFACTMYPGDSAFVKNVEAEVIDNVKRLRNHPSIIHWNGNNEVDVAWNNWGWQDKYGYSAEDSAKIWNDYLLVFHDKIPALLAKLDSRPYSTTSPLSNWGKPENFNYASMHYWGVWHGGDVFEDFEKNVGRFMSEYGFQSFPGMETISYFADSSQWNLESEVMKHHQKSYVGNGMIAKFSSKYFDEPDGFEDFVLKSQMTQAKAMQMAIDAHRLRKGHCWGTLFWQLNDCWPGPSWSAVDVFGRKKVLYDELSWLYALVALIPTIKDGVLSISLVNDSLEDFEGAMVIEFYDEEGNLQELEKLVVGPKNGITSVYSEQIQAKFKQANLKLVVEDEEVFTRPVNLR